MKIGFVNCFALPNFVKPFVTPAHPSLFKQTNQSRIHEIIRVAKCDVLGLCEIWTRGDLEYAIDVGKHFGYTASVIGCYPVASLTDVLIQGPGLLLLSKHIVSDNQFFPFSVNGGPFVVDWFGGKGVLYAKFHHTTEGPVHVFLSHTIACYVPSRNDEKKPKKDSNFYHRLLQIRELANFISRKQTNEPDVPCIFMGDLNATPECTSVIDLKHQCKLEQFGSVGPTLRNNNPFEVDYILTTHLKYIREKKGKFDGQSNLWLSDHHGIWQEFEKTSQVPPSFPRAELSQRHWTDALGQIRDQRGKMLEGFFGGLFGWFLLGRSHVFVLVAIILIYFILDQRKVREYVALLRAY